MSAGRTSSRTPLKKAVVLLSGGLDSATTLAIAKAEEFACYAISFDYGQRHRAELDGLLRVRGLNQVPFMLPEIALQCIPRCFFQRLH